MGTVAFAAEPTVRHYGLKDESYLAEALSEQTRSLLLSPLGSVREVTFDADGQALDGGARWTRLALYQLCTRICPGLFRVFEELAGARAGSTATLADYSTSDALALLNRVVERRYASRLSGWQLLRDVRKNRIEGVVSVDYRWLPQQEFYEQVKSALEQSERPPHFLEAILAGRSLLVRYYDARTFVRLGPDERIVCAWSFANHECADRAITASSMLLHTPGREAALLPRPRQYRHPHRGNSVLSRLTRTVAMVLKSFEPADFYAEHIAKLHGRPLGISRQDSQHTDRVCQNLRDGLFRLRQRLTVHAARKIVYQLRRELEEQDRSGNFFDLYLVLGRIAQDLPWRQREQLERTAYTVLLRGQTLLGQRRG
jgi:hypothetical protein